MLEKYYNLPFTDGAVGSQGNCNGWVVPGLSPQYCSYPAQRYVVFSASVIIVTICRGDTEEGEPVTECLNNGPSTSPSLCSVQPLPS